MSKTNGIVNHTAARKLVLEYVDCYRPGWKCTRVSRLYLDELEVRVRAMIRKDVKAHPTLGHTMKP